MYNELGINNKNEGEINGEMYQAVGNAYCKLDENNEIIDICFGSLEKVYMST